MLPSFKDLMKHNSINATWLQSSKCHEVTCKDIARCEHNVISNTPVHEISKWAIYYQCFFLRSSARGIPLLGLGVAEPRPGAASEAATAEEKAPIW